MEVLGLLNKRLGKILSMPITLNVLRLIALSYASLAAPRLPDRVAKLFDNDWFKMVFLTLLVFIGSQDLLTSVILGIGFVLSVNYISKQKLMEQFRNEQNTNIVPGCLQITAQQLLDAFDGDVNALTSAIEDANVPHNIRIFNDHFAPQIATYLANAGKDFKGHCQLPPQ